MSSFGSSYFPRSMLAHPASVREAFPAGKVTYTSGCATGLLVRLSPRHTYELYRPRSAPTVCAATGAVASALATTRAAPRTFARFIVSPDEEVVTTRGNEKAPRIRSSGPGTSRTTAPETARHPT